MNSDASSMDDVSASGVYAFLARLWLKEIDAAFLEQLRDTPLGSALIAAGGTIPQPAELEDLAAEYCRLFIGPKDHLPPLQSVWAQGTLQSEITSSVTSFAEALGYEDRMIDLSTMPDHLGMQLDIMSFALQRRAEVSSNDILTELISEFFRRHLTWPYMLISNAKQRCEMAFYQLLIEMTEEFLSEEATRLQIQSDR